MSVPTVALNENTPDGGDYKRDGDNRIREHKKQVREILDIDHKYDSSGQDADMGKHNQCSFLEAADIGTGAEGKPILGAQTISGKAELVFTDEDDNDVQITSAGALVGATAQSIIAIIYPVGAIYLTEKNENPGTTLGVGTWVAYAAGKVIVGLDAADSSFDTIGETGGEKTHVITLAESPAHTHATASKGGSAASDTLSHTGSSAQAGYSTNTDSKGGDGAHNNLQPYVVAYAWKRTV